MKDTMKALDPISVVKELMSYYLESKSYNSETFLNYVARDVRTHNDKFTAEDRAICKKVAEEKIETIIEAFENEVNKSYDYAWLDINNFNIIIWGRIDSYDLELICKCSKKLFMTAYDSVFMSAEKELALVLLIKAFIGK